MEPEGLLGQRVMMAGGTTFLIADDDTRVPTDLVVTGGWILDSTWDAGTGPGGSIGRSWVAIYEFRPGSSTDLVALLLTVEAQRQANPYDQETDHVVNEVLIIGGLPPGVEVADTDGCAGPKRDGADLFMLGIPDGWEYQLIRGWWIVGETLTFEPLDVADFDCGIELA